MPLTDITDGNVYELTIRGTLFGVEWETRRWFQTIPENDVDPAGLNVDFSVSDSLPALLAVFGASVSVQTLRTRKWGTPPTPTEEVAELSIAESGTRSGEASPFGADVSVPTTLHGRLSGRTHKNRMWLPGLWESDVDGSLLNTGSGRWRAMVDAFLTQLADDFGPEATGSYDGFSGVFRQTIFSPKRFKADQSNYAIDERGWSIFPRIDILRSRRS